MLFQNSKIFTGKVNVYCILKCLQILNLNIKCHNSNSKHFRNYEITLTIYIFMRVNEFLLCPPPKARSQVVLLTEKPCKQKTLSFYGRYKGVQGIV